MTKMKMILKRMKKTKRMRKMKMILKRRRKRKN
jgi:hypothetical protein